jgi:YD repeat-containing protein
MCGRSVEFAYFSTPAARGLVRSISDSLGRTMTYNYDGNRQLVNYVDAQKITHDFRYDKKGNSVEYKNSSDPSASFTITYNEESEVRSQLGPEKNRSEYKRSYIANDRNNSITEIQKFDGAALVGREIHEFKLGEYEIVTKYDKSGKELSKITKRFSKQTGYPVSILDAKGEGDLFEYSGDTGNIISRENVVSKEKLTYTYEPRCNQVNGLKISRPGVPTKETQYKFDGRCNVIEAVQTQSGNRIGWIEVKHNAQGRAAFLLDKQNNSQIAFTFWQYGKPESITLRDVGTLLVKYKPDGEMEEVKTRPHGKGEARFKAQDSAANQAVILREVRSTLDVMLGLLRPAGLTIGL